MTPIEPTPYSKDYEITDAMFGAFRSPGGARFFWILFAWGTLFYSIVYGLFALPAVKIYLDAFANLMRTDALADDAAAAEVVGSLLMLYPLAFLLIIATLLIHALLRATFYRGYFTGETGGAFPFRFGNDEVRQALSVLGCYGTIMIACIGAFIALMAVTAGLGVAFGKAAVAVAGLLLFIGIIATIVGMIWIGVTLSPAGALTAMRGDTHVLAARHVSKNRFWALFGSLLVAGLISYVVQTVVSFGAIIPFLTVFMNGDMMAALSTTDADAAGEVIRESLTSGGFMISVFVSLVLSSASYAFYSLIMAGPTAFFTRQWAEAHAGGESYPDDREADD